MFSLKSLLFIVAVAGMGAAGLIHRTQFWASAMIALTLAVLLIAVCRAWFAPQGRTFWGPFALTGAVYLAIVSLAPLVELHYNLPTTQLVVYGLEKTQTPGPMQGTMRYVSGTTGYGTTAYYQAAPGVAASPAVPVTAYSPDGSIKAVYTSPGAPAIQSVLFNRDTLFQMATTRFSGEGFAAEARVFLWVAQCLWCLLLAFVMGLVCSWLFRAADATMSRPVGP